MRNAMEAYESTVAAGASSWEPEDERVFSMGRRQLTPFARLERFSCRLIDVPDGTKARLRFCLRVNLPQLARALGERSAPVVRVKIRGEGDSLQLAGRLARGTDSSWFSLRLRFEPGLDALGLVAEDLLRFGPAPIEVRELCASLARPLDLFRDRSLEPVQSWLYPVPLLAAALQESSGFALPERIEPLWVTAAADGEQLQIDGEPLEGHKADGGASGAGGLRSVRSDVSQRFEAALDAGAWDQARTVLRAQWPGELAAEQAFFELVHRCPELTAGEWARVRRHAHSGAPQALAAVAVAQRRAGQAHRASHWYRQLARAVEGVDPLTTWAVGEAMDEHFAALARVEGVGPTSDIHAGSIVTFPREASAAFAVGQDAVPGNGETGAATDAGGMSAWPMPSAARAVRHPHAAGERGTPVARGLEPNRRGSESSGVSGPVGAVPPVPALSRSGAPASDRSSVPPAQDRAAALVGTSTNQELVLESDGLPADAMPADVRELERIGRGLVQGTLTLERLARTREGFESREAWRELLVVLEHALSLASSPAHQNLLHHELAQVKVALGVPSRAVPHYEAVLAAIPDDEESIAFLRSQYAREGRHEARIRLEAQLVARQSGADGSRTLQALAEEATALELSELARTLLVEAFLAHPADSALLTRVTAELEAAEDWDTLLDLWTRRLPLLVHAQDRLQGGLKIAGYLRLKGDLDGAERLYRGMQRSGSEQPDVLDGLARVLADRGDWSGAAEMLERRSRLVTGVLRVEVALRLAEIYASYLGEPDTADGWYREALAEMPGDPRAAQGLIHQLEARGEWLALVSFLEGRLPSVVEPEARRELLLYLGDLYLVRLKDQEQALAYFQQADACDRAGHPSADGVTPV